MSYMQMWTCLVPINNGYNPKYEPYVPKRNTEISAPNTELMVCYALCSSPAHLSIAREL